MSVNKDTKGLPCGFVYDAGTPEARYCLKPGPAYHEGNHSFVEIEQRDTPPLLCVKCSGEGPFPSSDRISLEMLDYPTAWTIADKIKKHKSPKCSAVQTNGAILCDCGAVEDAWKKIKAVLRG